MQFPVYELLRALTKSSEKVNQLQPNMVASTQSINTFFLCSKAYTNLIRPYLIAECPFRAQFAHITRTKVDNNLDLYTQRKPIPEFVATLWCHLSCKLYIILK